MQTLKVSHVSKVYGQESNRVLALDDVSFEAKQGELTLILGPSGSGKSTLLTIIGGLQSPTSGIVQVNDQTIDIQNQQASDTFRLNQVGFVLQSHSLVPFLTVQQQFDLVNHVKKSGNLTSAQFQQYLKVLGIDALLDKYLGELSGGQAQRVAIARALYADPAFILADEPTAALDSDRVQKVGALFQQIAAEQQKAVVVVTHDLRLKQFADHIYTIEDGHIQQEKKQNANDKLAFFCVFCNIVYQMFLCNVNKNNKKLVYIILRRYDVFNPRLIYLIIKTFNRLMAL